MANRKFRIHGDNIIECEKTFTLILQSLNVKATLSDSATMYLPIFNICENGYYIDIELLSGHGRWGMDIADVIIQNGGELRESADSYITEVSGNEEVILLGIEYCSALPAGNNAWQRNGRAYASIQAGVPYLYFAEIGGLELNESRTPKAPRYPNPIVPFSYVSWSISQDSICLPVYLSHPSMSNELKESFKNIFGKSEALQIIKGIIDGIDYGKVLEQLLLKDIELVCNLSNNRRRIDTLRNIEWINFLETKSDAQWLLSNTIPKWKKKVSDKVRVTSSFRKFLSKVQSIPCDGRGADDLPVCLVPQDKSFEFECIIKEIYPDLTVPIDWRKPLAIVWITGFKPKGDDSRPDRGLTPLTRMVLNASANILAVVYGPAKEGTWEKLEKSKNLLSTDNGLWQSIFNVADYVLVDSDTSKSKMFFLTNRKTKSSKNEVKFTHNSIIPSFSEHDTDTAIHQMFSRKVKFGVYECLCNPPGGDWSGISYFLPNNYEVRWTSLPRVSKIGGKRPDHVIQYCIRNQNIIFSIESKRIARDLENNIGLKLKTYLVELYKTLPTAERSGIRDWQMFTQKNLDIRVTSIISVGAFIYQNDEELLTELNRGQLDAVMAFDFQASSCVVHIKTTPTASVFVNLVKKTSKNFLGLIIQVH